MRFKNILERVLRSEGGYSNHPNDRGGETYKGISRVFHPSWNGWVIIDAHENKNNIKNAILNEAVEVFYLENFWSKIQGDNITSEAVAYELFDTSVNMGIKTAVKLIQTVVGANADGIIGVNTLAAINTTNERLLVAEFKLAKIARYAYLVKKRPQNKVFLLGWVNRVMGA